MNIDKIVQQIQDVRWRMGELQRRADESPLQEQDLLMAVCEECQTTLAELSAVEEELRQQNEELATTQEAVEAERQRYQDLFEFAPDGYIVTDIKGTIQEANRAASSLLNIAQKVLVGKPLDLFFASEVRQIFLSKLTQLCFSCQVHEWEVCLHPRESVSFNAALTITAVRNREGKPIALCWLLRDITEDKQAEELLRQQTERSRLLNMMCDRIRQSLNLEEILNTTVSEVRQFLGCDRVIIYQLQPDWSRIVLVESVEQNWKSMLNATMGNISFEKTYLPLYQQGHISAIENTYAADLEESYLNLLAQFQVKAKLVVPLRQGVLQELEAPASSLWGLLIAHNCTATRQWQPGEIDLLSSLATQLAIAIQQAQLYRQTQQQAQREQALNQFTSAIRKILDLETIFATAAQEISHLLHVDHVEIQQYLSSRQVWLTVADYQQHPNLPSSLGREIPDVENEISRRLKQFEVAQINDPNTVQDAVSQELAQIYSGAWLLVPLHFQDSLWGSLCLMISERAYHWSEWEVDLVNAIATQLAISIQQGQFYQQLSTLNNNLECQVQERTAQLQQKIQELEQLNILKDDFLSTVSHELRTPLANMKMALQMLKIAPSPERQQRYLEICEAECNRETDLINDLLDLQRLQAESYQIALSEAINLQDWLPSFVEAFRSRTIERQHSLELDIPPDVPPIISDLTVLERILAELLNNACKYTPAGGKIIFRVRYQGQGTRNVSGSEGVTVASLQALGGEESSPPPVGSYCNTPVLPTPSTIFTVSNQAEIPAAELSRIFEKFYRVLNADPWKQGGTGLGLSLVQKLVEQLGGTIQVKSSGGWTSFIIQFPT